jgi:hypothetical protein
LPTVSKPPTYYTSLLFKISAFSVELLNESSPHGELTSTPGFFWFSLSASPTTNSLSIYRALSAFTEERISLGYDVELNGEMRSFIISHNETEI